MHAGGGTFAEWRRARSGRAQPWEYVPPDDATTSLMNAHAEEIARYRQEANPNIDPELIRQEAFANAVLFDDHARNWAYHEKKTVAEYYRQNKPEYRSWQPDFERADDGAVLSGGMRGLRRNRGNGIRCIMRCTKILKKILQHL